MKLSNDLCKIIINTLKISKDGIAVFSPADEICFINEPMSNVFGFTADELIGCSFEEIFRQAFNQKIGVLIKTEDIDEWINEALSKRRSEPFRTFEIEHRDGRWFLISEQKSKDNYILSTCSEITYLKTLESKLTKAAETLSKKAFSDELTGVCNRRAFSELGSEAFNRSQKYGHSSILVLLDIDHFKKINDNYGHQAGDFALIEFSKNIVHQLRDYDLIYRVGGEEFAILFPDTPIDGVLEICERVRNTTEKLALTFNEQSFSFTVSAGISQANADTTFTGLYAEADKALYQAKSQGRNRVIIFQTD